MARRALHLLLALTLALNGISAPWAMERMNKASHAAHGTHEHGSVSADAEEEADTHAMHHAQHGGHDMAAMPSPVAPAAPMEESCCNGPACECGCVLPPVVPLMALMLTPQPLSEASFVFPARHAAVRRDTPPFRPPAV